jgi:rsbT antagonist protein RsbS
MAVAILRQGDHLVASIQSDLTDAEVLALRDTLLARVGTRTRGIIIDVAALDVIDSFVARALRSIALAAALRGARTIVVGIQPDVAIAMVHFDLNLEPLQAALDLDEALALLEGVDMGDSKDER